MSENNTIEYESSNNLTLFLPGFIDDYGFNAAEFRVFSRIMRRCAGNNSKGFYESIPKLAKSLMLSQDVVRRALNILTACGAVTRKERKGKPDLFNFQVCEKWQPSENLPKIRKNLTKKRVRESKKQVVTETAVVMETIGQVVMETTDKGTPIKGTIYARERNVGLEVYRKFYSTFPLNDFQEQILNEVKPEDEQIFFAVMKKWKGKGYQARNVFGMVEMHNEQLSNAESSSKSKTSLPRPAAAGGSPYVSAEMLKEMEMEFLAEFEAQQVAGNAN